MKYHISLWIDIEGSVFDFRALLHFCLFNTTELPLCLLLNLIEHIDLVAVVSMCVVISSIVGFKGRHRGDSQGLISQVFSIRP